jgi:hypothetical protein
MSLEPRLAASVRIRAMRQMAEAAGGFAMVIKKGDETSGAILVQWLKNGRIPILYEQMPGFDGPGEWVKIQEQDPENQEKYLQYVSRRCKMDGDIWVVELDIADEKRFIELLEHFR